MQAGGVRTFHGWVVAAATFAVQFIAFVAAHTCAACFASFQSGFQASRGGVSLLTEPSASLRMSVKNDKS